MRRSAVRTLGFALVLTGAIAGCAGTPSSIAPPATGENCSSCPRARAVNGWCEPCSTGYVAGLRVPSPMLFEALDAHGHAIDPAGFRCQTCKTAITTSGYCESCQIGFVGGQAYFSRLTYIFARGTVLASTPSCVDCARAADTASYWCTRCERGRVGNTEFRQRAEFDVAHTEYQRLAVAVAQIPRCETCAVSSFTGVRCPIRHESTQ